MDSELDRFMEESIERLRQGVIEERVGKSGHLECGMCGLIRAGGVIYCPTCLDTSNGSVKSRMKWVAPE